METNGQLAVTQPFYAPIIMALNWLCSVLCSILIIGAFAGIMYFTGARGTWLWLNAMTWEQTQCEINQVYNGRQETSDGAGSTSVSISFKVSASYKYRNDLGAFAGHRYDFKMFRDSFQSVKKDLYYLRNNASVPCYFNPRKPEQAVIDRGFQTSFLFMLIPLFSIGLFAYLAFTTLLTKFGINKLLRRK